MKIEVEVEGYGFKFGVFGVFRVGRVRKDFFLEFLEGV